MNPWRIRPVSAVVALTALAVATIAVSTALLLWDLRRKEIDHYRGETVSLSRMLAEQTTHAIQNVDLVMQNTRVVLAELAAKNVPLDSFAVHEILRNQMSGMPQVGALFVVDADGMAIAGSRSHPTPRRQLIDREYFAAQKNSPGRGLYISSPMRTLSDGTWTLFLSRRLTGPHGEFRGVIAASLDLAWFEALYESIGFGGISPIALSLVDGTLVARQPHDENAIGTRIAGAAVPDLKEGGQLTRHETDAAGEPSIASYHRVSKFPLLVSVAIDEDTALEDWREKVRLFVFGAAFVIVSVAAAAWALARALRKEDALAFQLRESGERLVAMINSALDAIIMVDAGQRVVVFNSAAEKMFGYKAAEAIGAPLERFLPERFRAAHRGRVEKFGDADIRSRMMAPQLEVVGLRADGTEFPIETSISKLKLGGEILYTAILRDITQRREAEQRLRESNRQLRELSSALQTVREEERTRIARELHDELGQQLTRLKLDVSWLANQIVADAPAKIAGKLDSMKEQINTTIKSVRRISTELRPPMLDDLGLCAAIEWLCADFSQHSGVAVELDLANEDCAPGEAVVTSLYRIVQEGLTNVARHAEATQVRIALKHIDEGIELTIADNGKGMGTAKSEGQGLIGIRERALMIGGTAAFASDAGAGATIRIVVPTSAGAEHA